jgi:DNA-binding MarR family transcriptional regulator
MSAREIGEQTAMDKVKVSRAVARLSARKLVRREVNPLDQRAVLLGLTPAGRTVYESVVPAALEMESAIFSELRPDEVAQFARTLDRIESRIADFAALESDEPADGKLPRRAFRKVAKPRATRRRKPA